MRWPSLSRSSNGMPAVTTAAAAATLARIVIAVVGLENVS